MTDRTNSGLWARREDAVARGVGSMHQIFAHSGANATLTDVEGNDFIDFATGIAVCNTGHSHPDVLRAVEEQMNRFSHVSFQVTPYDSYVALAEKLNMIAPGPSPKKSVFLTTGAEAVENAVKIARAYTKRRAVIAFRGGYHGRTLLTMGLTGKVQPYKATFGPMPGDLYHASYPLPYLGITEDMAFQSLMDVFASDVEADATAAIILEPVLGEGGFYVAPPSFMKRLRDFCDENGILLIADEIQSGFARTGKMFATDYSDIEPDLMTVAKAMAGGFPISGVVGKAEIMDAPGPGGLGGTYGGSPLGCAAGLAVLDVIERQNLCGQALAIGERIQSRLKGRQKKQDPGLGDIRGLGAMCAAELVKDGDASQPDPERTKAVVAAAREENLILLSCGIRGNVLRFLPALTADMATIDLALDRLEIALDKTQ